MKVLFLIKQDSDYGYYASVKAGLFNSAKFLVQALEQRIIGIECKLSVCIDANCIDKEVFNYKPKVVVIEALWVTPEKMTELHNLHPGVIFVIRVHSNLPFLSNEGIAIAWIKAYDKIKNVFVSFNNLETSYDFVNIGFENLYLQNIYGTEFSYRAAPQDVLELARASKSKRKRNIKIGCFGAIRPLKNQLIQSVAAIGYADSIDATLSFYINSSRVEQNGQSTLANIRALFNNTRHILVEVGWLEHADFIDLVKTMDLGMQVSLTESFNIVTADFAASGVPIIVSPEIDWMPDTCKVTPYSVYSIMNKIDQALTYRHFFSTQAVMKLYKYNAQAISNWNMFFKNVKRM